MKFQRVNQILAIGLSILLASTFAARAVSQQQEDAAHKKQSPLQKSDAGTRQGTPVLGIVVAKSNDGDLAEVVRVWPGSPAEQAGLKAGDRIVKVGDNEVASPETIRSAVLQHSPGEQIAIEISRNDEPHSLEVRLSGADGLFGWIRRGAIPETAEPSAWLGVQLDPVASADDNGVLVSGVLTGSPADHAGIKSDDVILRVDETRVEAAADLKMAIAGHRPGETVKFTIRQGGEQKTLEVELGSFARWHGNVSLLSEGEARELLENLIAAPFALAEELLPDEVVAKRLSADVVDLPQLGVAQLHATKGNKAQGTIVLRQQQDGLHLTGQIEGLAPGMHGFHIHKFGDPRDPAGKAAGGHFNPRETEHGGPQDKKHHAGDLGNVEANGDGVADVDIVAPWLKLHFVIGRSIVVHGGKDDLESQPSGDAGPRVAVGIIGIANPSEQSLTATATAL